MAKAKKFGAISGVFTPSILTILGVIMYLRLPWIVGQAGLWATVGIIIVAHIISFTTSLSVSSIATDKKVEAGGTYYIISRSLGLPIGGTLGLALFVGLSFSVSLYLIGFAEVLLGYFGLEVTINNIRIAGAAALLVLTILTFISTSLAIKSQYVILTILGLSLISIFFGNHSFDPSQPLIAPMEGALPWIALFAIFFPAVTGFEAGVSMSGDLKDPRRNIPMGTITAVLVGLIIYLGLTLFLSHTVSRNMLANDPSVLFQIAWIPQLVVAGILGATLSSALGSILGAPRILQATAIDRITHSWLGKGYGASNEPRNALIFTFIIALTGILIGELNVIARIVTIFFIITYGFLNITYAVESWAGSDFRPSFKIPGVVSVIGALACIIVMIQLDVIAMLGASLVLVGLFLFLKRRELTLQTGDTWNSIWSSLVKTGLGKLTANSTKSRNWRPNVILFSGGVKHRPYLIETGKALSGKLGIFTNFELVESKDEKHLFSKSQQIIKEEISGGAGVFTRRHVCRDIYEGIESIAKIYGFSGFEPNTILMGWPRHTRKPEAFIKLIRSFRKQDYNQIYLNYNKEKGFGKRQHIDIWWSGKGRNVSFALALIRFLTSSEEWRQARLRILAINPQTNFTDRYYELLQQVLENHRIKADLKIINNSVEQLPAIEIIRQESIKTDLTILELDDSGHDYFEKTNLLTENLPSCMIIQSSSSFDELAVVTQAVDDAIREPEIVDEPGFAIASQIKLANQEIIANEVYNVARNLEEATSNYYYQSFGQLLARSLIYHEDLLEMAEKTSEQLYKASKTEDPRELSNEFLRILNDFSFRAMKSMKSLRQELIMNNKQSLHGSTLKYFDQIDKYLQEMPVFIRVKYGRKEFKAFKADSFAARIFRISKLFWSRLTGKPVVYKIKVQRAARYYLFHKRLITQQELFQDFALHSFGNIVNIRKVFSELFELSEKGKSGFQDKEKLRNIIQLERDRFRASISLQQEQIRNFYHKTGKTLEDNLLDDLQLFNNMIDRPGSNFLSKRFPKACNSDPLLLEEITSFPEVWQTNANLLINKVYLDFLLQSLKNRIEAKIRKYNMDFQTAIFSAVFQPILALKKDLDSIVKTGNVNSKPDKGKFKSLIIEEQYMELFNEINSLFTDLPVVLSIGGEDLVRDLDAKKFSETREIIVSVRKTIEFSIASELIDFVKKQALEASNALTRSVNSIKDIIRLINFNLYDETDDNQSLEERTKLAADFLERIEQQENTVKTIISGFEASFDKGLKNAFAPLSSGIIAKTSGSIAKKFKANEGRRVLGRFATEQKEFFRKIQQQLVNLVYSRSESILWVGKMEKPTLLKELSNEEVYSYLDRFTPSPEIMKELPFYYSKLFSGQSGIGEDFWVGMEEEVAHAATAIKRFKNGQPGCLIITGERNSGKTSLAKFVARQHFASEDVRNIRAPRECMADVALFEQYLMQSLNSSHADLESALNTLQKPGLFIINDMELWWERKSGGTAVAERLLQLIKKYHGKALFVVNINIHALRLLNQITGLLSWSLAQVTCRGFDARELNEMIMLRHKAGGMSLVLDKKHESALSAWEFARLFNRYFDFSKGIPGIAINLWLASIIKVSGKTLYMRKPPQPDLSFLDKLSHDQIFFLIQFVYHLRLSAQHLAELLQIDKESLENQLQNLWQSGILMQKFPDIYSINPGLQQPLVEKMKQMKLI